MLSSLSIKNFALIEDVTLDLNQGFSVITGETGAGKSILLGALSLLLGKRADLTSVRDNSKKCVVEGIFQLQHYQLEEFFNKTDLDYDPQTIIRREILPSGKSRAFVNDTPVKLQQLSGLAGQLVDVHSQHETLEIGEAAYQYQVLDALSKNAELLKDYQNALKEYQKLLKQQESFEAEQAEQAKTHDYHLFLLSELNEAGLEEGMQEELEDQYQQLNNVEELKEQLSGATHYLQHEEIGSIVSLQAVKNRLVAIEGFGKTYQDLAERLKSILIEAEDISSEIESLENNVEADPETLNQVNDKLQQLYNLQKKHQVDSVEELIIIQQGLQEKVSKVENAEEEKRQLAEAVTSAENKAKQLAKSLFESRKKKIKPLESKVHEILAQLGMPHAQLKVALSFTSTFNKFGADEVDWLLAANKGSDFKELRKAASGGELSRITLAVKSILAENKKLPTIIFDEIDTGVSGDISQKMGTIMNKMGEQMQVIAITHLPQIAARGDHHFKVFKDLDGKTTTTNIEMLDKNKRVEELAEMLSGKQKTDSAIAHAKQLLN